MTWQWPNQWPPTPPFDVDGMKFRVVPEEQAESKKRKKPGHVVLQWHDGSRWHEVTMSHAFVMIDFFFAEEGFLYPEEHHDGGHKFLKELRFAAIQGWQVARAKLRREVLTKQWEKDTA